MSFNGKDTVFFDCYDNLQMHAYAIAAIATQAPAQTAARAAQTLIDFAAGRAHHVCAGECPDAVAGYDSRDPYCTVCCAIDEVVLAVQPTPLTDDQIAAINIDVGFTGFNYRFVQFVRAIELAHGISAPMVPIVIPAGEDAR